MNINYLMSKSAAAIAAPALRFRCPCHKYTHICVFKDNTHVSTNAILFLFQEEVRQYRVLRDSQSLASDYQHVSQPSCGGAPVITDEVRQALQLPVVSEEDYHELQCKGSRMTLHEYAQVRGNLGGGSELGKGLERSRDFL